MERARLAGQVAWLERRESNGVDRSALTKKAHGPDPGGRKADPRTLHIFASA